MSCDVAGAGDSATACEAIGHTAANMITSHRAQPGGLTARTVDGPTVQTVGGRAAARKRSLAAIMSGNDTRMP
jgi:hypothetical protein